MTWRKKREIEGIKDETDINRLRREDKITLWFHQGKMQKSVHLFCKNLCLLVGFFSGQCELNKHYRQNIYRKQS